MIDGSSNDMVKGRLEKNKVDLITKDVRVLRIRCDNWHLIDVGS